MCVVLPLSRSIHAVRVVVEATSCINTLVYESSFSMFCRFYYIVDAPTLLFNFRMGWCMLIILGARALQASFGCVAFCRDFTAAAFCWFLAKHWWLVPAWLGCTNIGYWNGCCHGRSNLLQFLSLIIVKTSSWEKRNLETLKIQCLYQSCIYFVSSFLTSFAVLLTLVTLNALFVLMTDASSACLDEEWMKTMFFLIDVYWGNHLLMRSCLAFWDDSFNKAHLQPCSRCMLFVNCSSKRLVLQTSEYTAPGESASPRICWACVSIYFLCLDV